MTATIHPFPSPPPIRAIEPRGNAQIIDLRPEFALMRFANAARRHAEMTRAILDERADETGRLAW